MTILQWIYPLLLPDIWVIADFATLSSAAMNILICSGTCVRNLKECQEQSHSLCDCNITTKCSGNGCYHFYHLGLRYVPSHTWFKRLNYFYNPVSRNDLWFAFSDYCWDWVAVSYGPFTFSLLWNACFISIA